MKKCVELIITLLIIAINPIVFSQVTTPTHTKTPSDQQTVSQPRSQSLVQSNSQATGQPIPDCKFPPYLAKGFDTNSYSQCDKFIKQCPGSGVLHEKSCVEGITKKYKSCAQFRKLVTELHLPANQVTVTSLGEFSVVTLTFPADGQFSYYIISPNGCLLDTKIDPRKLDSNLNSQFQNKSFMMTYAGEPQYQTNSDGTPSIAVVLRITDTCIACPLIGYAKIKFDFDKNGNLTKTSLVSFDKNKP